MVDRRWAMTIVVRSLPTSSSSSAACTTRSDSVSRADVASSSTRIRGSRTSARAIAMRCFCPPDSWMPLSPTCVLYPSGMSLTKACALASRAACVTAASVERPYAPISVSSPAAAPRPMFQPMLPENSTGSWLTNPTCERSHCTLSERMSTPSSIMLPPSTSYQRSSSATRVLLPQPDGPASATVWPASIRRHRLW
mmetsp:Transcript_31754/g.82982  ORF Transcript_31754/g.82982 Transcript_31754/m.82982 type:complete len:196 (+) Transcript_31754:698-1285(+)